MRLPVVWLSYKEDIPSRGYWDMGLIESIFSREIWKPVAGHEFYHKNSLEGIQEGAVVVFPARAQVEYAERLNDDLSGLKWVILMLTGDEEASFPWQKIKHPNMQLYVMSPRQNVKYPENTRFLGTGFPPDARRLLKENHKADDRREADVFFAGQITHDRRKQCATKLEEMSERDDVVVDYVPTAGFTQGLERSVYYQSLANAKVAPCPSGPETPDTFRLFEALEAGCIPIADALDPKGAFDSNYWTWFFSEEPPFPVLTNYDQLTGYTLATIENYNALANKIFAWWLFKKRQMVYQLEEDIFRLRGNASTIDKGDYLLDNITVIIPSSPIAAHPDTSMIEEAIAAVRAKLPNSEIIITLDGVRDEQKNYQDNYQEYISRLLWKCHHEWSNVLPLIFTEHTHQAGMAREALKHVKTSTILYVEHDAPITPDNDFEWEGLIKSVLKGEANVIRFHHEAKILPEHEHLMLSPVLSVEGVRMRQTMQWSQRPHLASTAFYRHMIETYFNPKSRTMIEDVMHGIVIEACRRDGVMGWHNFRVWIYTPSGQIKRSYHLDGRGDDPKFEMDIKPMEGK